MPQVTVAPARPRRQAAVGSRSPYLRAVLTTCRQPLVSWSTPGHCQSNGYEVARALLTLKNVRRAAVCLRHPNATR